MRMCVCCVTVANAGVLFFVLFLLFWAALLSQAWRDVIFIKQFGNALLESFLSAWLIPMNPASCHGGKLLMKCNHFFVCSFVYYLFRVKVAWHSFFELFQTVEKWQKMNSFCLWHQTKSQTHSDALRSVDFTIAVLW